MFRVMRFVVLAFCFAYGSRFFKSVLSLRRLGGLP